jgi:hypothetical protein
MTYLEAIADGLRQAMRADASVIVLGEDVGAYGGAFKLTKGLLDEFGPQRVIDTPISEAGIVGAAVGAALVGLRPVAEMQFADFSAPAFEQIVGEKGHVGAEWFFCKLVHGLAHVGGNGRAYLGKRWVTKNDKRKEKQAAKRHKRLQKIRPWIAEEYSESRRCRASLQLAGGPRRFLRAGAA